MLAQQPRSAAALEAALSTWLGGVPVLVEQCFPTWTDPVGAIHWAGTETTFQSLGGMNGAVTSGERAAGEVLSALAVEVEPAVA